ncbi:MAG: PQQ-binding-like beta-propeller repeat protein [Planctomycetota bacterium]|nr:PQQ-binding-like beta-propeller repeat protein [Planctomycetota bacterium]
MMRRLATLTTTLLLAAPAATAQGSYSVPSPREVRQASDDALAHLEAGRFGEALDQLELLLDSGRTSLIDSADEGRWIGAAPWARAQLEAAPAELRALFALRSAGRLELELTAAASAAPDERAAALIELANRYPTTPGATRAWMALGDMHYEAGNPDAARAAWAVAERAAAHAGSATDDAEAIANALTVRRRAIGNLALAPERAVEPPPTLDGAWFFDLPPSPSDGRLDHLNLRPVADGQRVYFNTGLRVLAVDGTRGEELWDSGEPEGWDELSSYRRRDLVQGVGFEDLVTSLALTDELVIAPLQLAMAQSENSHVDGLKITVSLPERRLFAFDRETGDLRWSHAPTPAEQAAAELTGLQLPFPKRASIAAAPVVVGDKVLVATYELVGRINLFVAAYDLDTGAELWRTAAISGQQRVNLFGEHEVEFNSAPLTVEGERVILQTQLGAVVAMDVSSGEPLWATGYEQYPLPKTRGYWTPDRRRRWQNTAPLVYDGVVLATPIDSPELIALDLETGEERWTVEGYELERSVGQLMGGGVVLDHLAAVGPEGVWIGGDVLAALVPPGLSVPGQLSGADLASAPPTVVAMAPIETPGSHPGRSSVHPRALVVAAGKDLVVATDEHILAVDRATASPRVLGPAGELGEEQYSPAPLAVASGRVVTLDDWRLVGWLHWDTLIAEGRAALGATPSPLATLELAEMLLARAEIQRVPGGLLPGFLEDPSAYLDEASALLTTVDPTYNAPRLDRARFHLLEATAAHLADRGQVDAAVLAIEAASETSTSLPGLDGLEERTRLACATLAVLGKPDAKGSLGSASRDAARARALELLATDLATDSVPTALELGDLELFAEGLTVAEGSAPGALSLTDFGLEERSSWRSLGRRLPVGVLALAARAQDRSAAGDDAGALSDLHDALWDFGPLELADGISLTPMLAARIDALLDRAGPDAERLYAPFEAQARDLLDRARRVPLDERTLLLAGIALRYPHSSAAEEADLELLEAELASYRVSKEGLGDLAAAAHRALAVPRSAAPARALLALGWALAEDGNPHLARLFFERLVADPTSFGLADADELRPGFTDGASAAELLAALPTVASDGPETRADLPTFGGELGASTSTGAVRLGSFEPLLTVDLGDAGQHLVFSSNNSELFAFASDTGGQVAWTFPIGSYSSIPWERRLVALPAEAPERLCVIGSHGLVALDPTTGHYRWEAARRGHRPLEVAGDGGLVVVEWLGPSGRSLEAFDAFGGASLWTLDLESTTGSGRVLGSRLFVEGHLGLLMDRDPRGRTVVVDLIRGRIVGELDLGTDGEQRDREAAWITDGQLFLPHFFAARGRRPNAVEVWDLERLGSEPLEASYAIELGEAGELAAMAFTGQRSYLWLTSTGTAGDRIIELDPTLGATREVARLEVGERPLGFTMGESTHLSGDLVVTVTIPGPGAGRDTPMRMRGLALPLGAVWTLELAQPADPSWSLYDGSMPAPCLSTRSVALCYALVGEHAAMGQQVRLLLIDRRSGEVTQDRVLTSRLGRVDDIHLAGLGAELMLFGRGTTAGRGRLEVLGSQAR